MLPELLLLRLRWAGQGVSRVGRQPLQSITPRSRVAAAAPAVEGAAGRRRHRQGRWCSRRDGRGSATSPERGEEVELRRLYAAAEKAAQQERAQAYAEVLKKRRLAEEARLKAEQEAHETAERERRIALMGVVSTGKILR